MKTFIVAVVLGVLIALSGIVAADIIDPNDKLPYDIKIDSVQEVSGETWVCWSIYFDYEHIHDCDLLPKGSKINTIQKIVEDSTIRKYNAIHKPVAHSEHISHDIKNWEYKKNSGWEKK